MATTVYGADGVRLHRESGSPARQLYSRPRLGEPRRLHGEDAAVAHRRSEACLAVRSGFKITIREFKPSIGAGFLVALTGEVMTMPGLPKVGGFEADGRRRQPHRRLVLGGPHEEGAGSRRRILSTKSSASTVCPTERAGRSSARAGARSAPPVRGKSLNLTKLGVPNTLHATLGDDPDRTRGPRLPRRPRRRCRL
ncbi:MAG: formate--tetrahydrofolate ligase [Candidatus Moduliflexus flocculans]|nr:formate--tetrahydrofolate ligase [Candidatus Moduliflexus flocculans]